MVELLLSIISAIILCLIVFIPKHQQHKSQTALYNLVSWCVTKDSSIHRCNLPLYSYVYNAQNDLDIPPKYKLSISNDKNVVEELLRIFQSELIDDYFAGNLEYIQGKYVIPGNHYFMFALNTFLEKHQCDSSVSGHDMHKKNLAYNQHGSWGAPLYDARYELSDFAIVYHKLYYITYLFCRESKVFNAKGTSFQYSESISKILDTNQIDISRL